MTYRLPANFTGYSVKEIGIETFRKLCYTLQNRQLLRIQSIHGYDYPKNYYVAYVTDNTGDFCIYMNCFCGVIGFSSSSIEDEEPTYLDKPTIKRAISEIAPEMDVLNHEQLNEAITKANTINLEEFERNTIVHWSPKNLGDALFT